MGRFHAPASRCACAKEKRYTPAAAIAAFAAAAALLPSQQAIHEIMRKSNNKLFGGEAFCRPR
jgi:hypothetical protein